MPFRASTRRGLPAAVGGLALSAAPLIGTGSTNLEETNALVWIMIAIGAAGAIVTFGFLVYTVWRFRDPKMKRRRYG